MPHSPELRQQIEELALQLVIAESGKSGARWLPALESIREHALREQSGKVAAAATALIDSFSGAEQPKDSPDNLAEVLQAGVVHLQQAWEGEDQADVSAPVAALSQDPELLSDFILESREHLAAIESQLLVLETDPGASEALNSVFRGFHTIKGLAGFLELSDVQKLAHETETVLDRARSSQWRVTPPAIDMILESADYLRRWMTHLESELQNQPSEAPPANESLILRIRGLAADTAATQAETARDLMQMAVAIESAAGEERATEDSNEVKSATLAATAEAGAEARPCARVPEGAEPEAPANFMETARPETAAASAADATRTRNETMAVKVDTAKLDYLVDMAGEMVIAESLVRHDPELSALKNQALQRKIAQMTRITTELQKTAMAMRLVPIGPLFRRMSRLVRDLSRQFAKQVQMETEGDDIELDRTIVEELSDPLMHMVRNALDHGIETPLERVANGKKPVARLLLKAQHRAGQVVIEISDDGRGLDPAQIKAKAIQKGLISPEKEMSDAEVFNLIFEPGFTTAAQVTNVSGRGVGMDVVRRHIEKLRGRIDIRSALGRGASFLIKLPLTLAIIDGLVVGVGGERYIVPLFAVREMFRPTAETIWTVQQRSEMALVRGTLLPVHRLYRRFGVKPRSEDPQESVLVVAEVEGACYCLVVDELIGKQEVVIKTLGPVFRNVTGVAGGAILGDGRVGLILDLERLLKDGDHEAAR